MQAFPPLAMRMLCILCCQSQPWQTDLHLTKVSFTYVPFQEKYYQSHSSWCWKVPLEIIQSTHPAQSRINQSRLPRTVPGRALSTFQDGDSTTCPGSLHPHGKKKRVVIYAYTEFPAFHLEPIVLSLSLWSVWPHPLYSLLSGSYRSGWDPPWAFSSPCWTAPALPASPSVCEVFLAHNHLCDPLQHVHASFVLWVVPPLGRTLHFSLLLFTRLLSAHFSSLLGSLWVKNNPLVYQPPLPVSADLLRVHTVPSSRSLNM